MELTSRTPVKEGRLLAIDGLRGALALIVLTHHIFFSFGSRLMLIPSSVAVSLFFLMSGYVLTRSYDGDYVRFLLRRFLRLWPVYAACLVVAYAIANRPPIWTEFIWFPYISPLDPKAVDPPMWSLILESWAMPFMPFIVWAGTSSTLRTAIAMVIILCAAVIYAPTLVLLFFVGGAFLSKLELRSSLLESAIPQWLGKISYSLYLSMRWF